jgi:hypothetical protein
MYCMFEPVTALAVSNEPLGQEHPAQQHDTRDEPSDDGGLDLDSHRKQWAPLVHELLVPSGSEAAGLFNKTAILPSLSSVMPTASQPRAPSSLRARTDGEGCRDVVGASKRGRAMIRYSHLVISLLSSLAQLSTITHVEQGTTRG